jgi:hypothetical protein
MRFILSAIHGELAGESSISLESHLPHSISSRFSLFNYAILAGVVLVVLASCSVSTEPDYVEVKSRTLRSGDEIPTVAGDTVLALSGGTIGESRLNADVQLLESIGTVSYSVNDPYENRPVEYEGVLLESLFDQFGGAAATGVTITAIDDYQQVISRVDAEKWPIILALKADGEYAKRNHRGPSMIIYPYDQYSELEPTKYDPQWVWQIAGINFN